MASHDADIPWTCVAVCIRSCLPAYLCTLIIPAVALQSPPSLQQRGGLGELTDDNYYYHSEGRGVWGAHSGEGRRHLQLM